VQTLTGGADVPQPPNTLSDWPLWQFAELEPALDRGDDRAAQVALCELERLGIEVRFRLPRLCANRAQREGVAHA
jgi:hypothetical protein